MIDTSKTSELFDMIKKGELRPFKQFVELYGANLEVKYVSGYNPLMESVFLQKEDFIIYIIDKMKQVYANDNYKFQKYMNSTSSDGKTALIIATLTHGDTKLIELLLSKGADPSIKDLHGKMAKDYAPYALNETVEDFWNTYQFKSKFSLR